MSNVFESSQPLEVALSPLASFNDQRFDRFQQATSSDRRFLLARNAIRSLSNDLGMDEQSLTLLLSALSFLQENLQELNSTHEFENSKRGLLDFLSTRTKLIDEETIEKIKDRLATILVYSERFPFYLKNNKISRGFLPNLVSISTFVDMRANFLDSSDDYSLGEIGGFVPVIQCRIKLDSDTDSTEMVFQMSEDSIDDMINALSRAKKKSSALRDTVSKISTVY
ncbi:hypothetical protein NKJ59_14160 [Mesorhizobium australicum]|uniref:hypothetical protein n=1 Tax=Mesorhizobium australicum TaxID=536018 RepID=UPI00333505DF